PYSARSDQGYHATLVEETTYRLDILIPSDEPREIRREVVSPTNASRLVCSPERNAVSAQVREPLNEEGDLRRPAVAEVRVSRVVGHIRALDGGGAARLQVKYGRPAHPARFTDPHAPDSQPLHRLGCFAGRALEADVRVDNGQLGVDHAVDAPLLRA